MAKKDDVTDDGSTSEITEPTTTEVTEIVFVTMVRDEADYPAPHQAQVHPDEVKNYYSGGWVEKKDEAE